MRGPRIVGGAERVPGQRSLDSAELRRGVADGGGSGPTCLRPNDDASSRWARSVAGGPGTPGAPPANGRWVVSNFEHLQINILVFALALSGLYLHSIARERAGGLVLGLAIALKVMPVVFIPYLAYRQRWRASAYTLAAAAVFSLSPILVFGWSRFWEYVASWRQAVAVGWGVGGMNHSVYAMLDRAIGHGLVPLQTPPAFPLAESGEPVVPIASLVALGVVAAIALWRCRGGVELGSRASLAEWSILFIVAVLFGPVSRLYYLVVLLLPYTLLFGFWRREARSGAPEFLRNAERRGLGSVVLLSAAMGLLSSPELIGNRLADRLEMGSWITASVLLLLGAVLWLRPRLAGRA